MKLGIHRQTKEQRIQNGKKAIEKHRELGVGVLYMTKKQRQDAARKSLPTRRKLKVGIHGLTSEQLSENAKKTNSQKWMCLETGHISNSGGLSNYQKARGIDTSKRKRIE